MNDDIYERHRQAVEEWKSACDAVELSTQLRDRKRAELDSIGQELLASCADSKRIKPIVKRGRRAKVNGLAEAHAKATEMMVTNVRALS